MNLNDPFARLPEVPSFTVTSTTLTDGAPWPAEQMHAGVPADATPGWLGWIIAGHILGRAVLVATAEIPA
ncbi:hypothetical protein ACSDR0_47245 [Streptosporangium sp. G11]|uniref:hypothetical protein n=1 Tax=Streptosporangium sp. G11 TaxID=3436926 RepID=UPI003EB83F37